MSSLYSLILRVLAIWLATWMGNSYMCSSVQSCNCLASRSLYPIPLPLVTILQCCMSGDHSEDYCLCLSLVLLHWVSMVYLKVVGVSVNIRSWCSTITGLLGTEE